MLITGSSSTSALPSCSALCVNIHQSLDNALSCLPVHCYVSFLVAYYTPWNLVLSLLVKVVKVNVNCLLAVFISLLRTQHHRRQFKYSFWAIKIMKFGFLINGRVSSVKDLWYTVSKYIFRQITEMLVHSCSMHFSFSHWLWAYEDGQTEDKGSMFHLSCSIL